MAKFYLVFNRKKRLDKHSQAAIEYAVYINNNERGWYNSGYKIKPVQWNEKKMQVNAKHPHYLQINAKLYRVLKDIENAYFKAEALEQPFTVEDARRVIKGEGDTYKFSELAWQMHENDKNTLNEGYLRHQKTAINYFIAYSGDMYINRITPKIIQQYNQYLEQQGKSREWQYSKHRTLRKLLNYAVTREIITGNPYQGLKLKRGTSQDRNGLDFTELEKIEAWEPANESLALEKDLFLFSCYTGIRFGDLQNLTNENLKTDAHNQIVLSFVMSKTQKKRAIPVVLHLDKLFNGRPGEIVRKYQNEDTYIFPRLTNVEANRRLKIIQETLGIKQTLSTHIARHTFCSRLAEVKPDPYLIKQLAGHSDIRTSMIYIHQSKAALEKKLDNIEW